MTETVQIADSPNRVAWEMARWIAAAENGPPTGQTREYFLTLFHQCRAVGHGSLPEKVLARS